MKLALRLAIIGYNIIKKQGLFVALSAGAPGRQTVPLKGSEVVFYFYSNTRFQTKMMISFSFIMFLTISIFTIFLHLNVFPQLKDEITYSNLELCVKNFREPG